MPDAYLDADAIRAATFARHVEIHDTLDSTNNRAIELARDTTLDLPAIIAARHQTAGRGRGTNIWSSSAGSLTFSIILEPSAHGIPTTKWPLLSLTTATAIVDALSLELISQSEIQNAKSQHLAIKWPNDIMLNDAKLCGILTESPGGFAPAKNRLIIGIGMNINNAFYDHPPTSRGIASPISLTSTTGRNHNLHQILCNVLCNIHTRITQLADDDPQLFTTLQSHCWLMGKTVEVSQIANRLISGQCVGIDQDGSLLVQDAYKTHRIHSGALRVL